MRLSELGIGVGMNVHSITDIWIDSELYELADDGDTLIKVQATKDQIAYVLKAVRDLERSD